MSPEISTESLAHPSQEDTVSGLAGTTSATGRPNLVTRTGAPVRRTSSSTAKHVALNLEIAISCITHLYHGPIPWSEYRYSYRKASMGSSRAAFIAGSNPAIKPMLSSNAVEVTTANVEIRRRISPAPLVWWNSGPSSGRLRSTVVTAQPAATPIDRKSTRLNSSHLG